MFASHDVIAFVPTAKPAAARDFYEKILGLHLLADEPAALVFDANGVMLRLAKLHDLTPAPYTVLGWKVADIAASVRELTLKGVQFNRYDGLEQDDQGVWRSPGGARVAWFKDPDGNTLSLTQF